MSKGTTPTSSQVSDTPKLGTHALDSTGEKINQMLHLANDAQTETHYM